MNKLNNDVEGKQFVLNKTLSLVNRLVQKFVPGFGE